MKWVIFDEAGRYVCRTPKGITWSNRIKFAELYPSEVSARNHAEMLVKDRQWWVLSVSDEDIHGPAHGVMMLGREQRAYKIGSSPTLDVTHQEVEDLPHRIMATRLLFGEDMPAGIHNPYYVGKCCTSDRDYAKRRKLVDTLAAQIKSGKANLPRYPDGSVALPLPRIRGVEPSQLMSPRQMMGTNWLARIERKTGGRNT